MTKQWLFNLEFPYRPRITLGPVLGVSIILDVRKGFNLIQIGFILQPLSAETPPEQFLQYPTNHRRLSDVVRNLSHLMFTELVYLV